MSGMASDQLSSGHVCMQLKVKVKENWRENEELLDDYGYNGKIRTWKVELISLSTSPS